MSKVRCMYLYPYTKCQEYLTSNWYCRSPIDGPNVWGRALGEVWCDLLPIKNVWYHSDIAGDHTHSTKEGAMKCLDEELIRQGYRLLTEDQVEKYRALL